MGALRRKKVHERSLKQTNDQIAQVEQQIYSIEAANINQETLHAMMTAGKAMKNIHGNLTIDKVDATMYVYPASQAESLKTYQKSIANTIISLKGRTPRTARPRRGDRQRHHQRPHRRTNRRRRPGSRTRRHGARSNRRTHAQDRHRTRGGSTRCGQRANKGQE